MNFTYNALSHTFGDYTSYYDIEFSIVNAGKPDPWLMDFTLVEIENYDVSDLDPEVRAAIDCSFENAFEMGCFDEVLLMTAYAWGFFLDERDDSHTEEEALFDGLRDE